MKKLFSKSLVFFVFLFVALFVSQAFAANYVFKFPSGVYSFTDKNGTQYFPDANSMVTITDSTLIKNFLDGGFIPHTDVWLAASHDYGAASSGAGLTWTMSASEDLAVFVTATNLGAAGIAVVNADAGSPICFYNNSGYAITVKASGQTGIVVNTGQTVFLRGNGTDIVYAFSDAIIPNVNIWNGTGLPVVLKREGGTTYAANGTTTTTDGTTYTVPAGLLTAGKALRITVYGTIAGGNAAKGVNLYFGTGAVSSPRFIAATVGNFKAEFIVNEYTDTAHQQISAFALAGTVGGATTNVAADAQQTTVSTASAVTMKTQVYSNHANDTVTQTACVIELLP